MKTIRTIWHCLVLLATVLYAVSCTAFTAPKDPVTGIRQDAPAEWRGTPDPLDTPEIEKFVIPSEGHFGHEWMWR